MTSAPRRRRSPSWERDALVIIGAVSLFLAAVAWLALGLGAVVAKKRR